MTTLPFDSPLSGTRLARPPRFRLFAETLRRLESRLGNDRTAHPDDDDSLLRARAAARTPSDDPDRALLADVLDEYPHGTRHFARLMERFWGFTWSICQAILLNEADAEDAVQNTFLRAHRYLLSYRFEARFSTWLSRIARRQALNRLKARKRETEIVADILSDPEVFGRWKPWQSPPPGSASRDLKEALDRMDPDDRMLLVMHELEGYGYNEIADALETSAGAVRMRAMRARRSLREIFERQD